MAKRRVRLRGRSLIALALLGFLIVATCVIWRRSHGMTGAREFEALAQRRSELMARSALLQGEIGEAASRTHLVPIAERRLHMNVPSDSQIVILPAPTLPPLPSDAP